jgi:hypothetical protein
MYFSIRKASTLIDLFFVKGKIRALSMCGKTEANNLFYSVMRNRFYNVNISKITSIGYPDDEDVTVDPTDPINQKTYMQAHITVEPWTEVEQDAELGM